MRVTTGRGFQWVGALGVFLLSGAGACGGGSGRGDGDGRVEPVAVEELWGKSARLTCERFYVCCRAEERQGWLAKRASTDASFEQCTRDLTASLEARGKPLLDGIAAGKLVYHGDIAGQCLAKATAASCADFFASTFVGEGPSCDAAFEGKAAVGAANLALAENRPAGPICDGL